MLFRKIGSHIAAIKTGKTKISNLDMVIKSITSLNSENRLVQVCLLKPVVSENQLFLALEQSFSAFENTVNICKTLHIEFLVRVLGVRQCRAATEILGLKQGNQEIAVVVAGKSEGEVIELFKKIATVINFEEDDSLMSEKSTKSKKYLMDLYKIGQSQLDALSDLENPLEAAVMEKIAMLALET